MVWKTVYSRFREKYTWKYFTFTFTSEDRYLKRKIVDIKAYSFRDGLKCREKCDKLYSVCDPWVCDIGCGKHFCLSKCFEALAPVTNVKVVESVIDIPRLRENVKTITGEDTNPVFYLAIVASEESHFLRVYVEYRDNEDRLASYEHDFRILLPVPKQVLEKMLETPSNAPKIFRDFLAQFGLVRYLKLLYDYYIIRECEFKKFMETYGYEEEKVEQYDDLDIIRLVESLSGTVC